MQLTMMGEYAIRAMIHLALQPSATTVHITEISSEWEIPENFLRKIIARLSRAGLIYSQRGADGGIQLAGNAGSLTILDVIEAIEGKIHLNRCLLNPHFCTRTNWCAVHQIWCEAQKKLKEILSSKTLAELASETANRKALSD